MIVDELITLLKFDVAGMSGAQAFDTVLSKIEEHSKEIVLGITGAVTSVGFFADRVSKSISENYSWAQSLGVASDSYQRLEHAAKGVGGTLDDIKGDLSGWVRSAKASGQTLEEVFLQETQSIKGMTKEQSYALLSARGYSDTAIRMIQQGEGELKRFLAQAEVIPEENLKAAQEYAKTWREVSSQVNQLMTSAVASALPALKGILNTIREFVQRNREIVKSGVTVFFKSMAVSLKIVFAALSPLVRGIEILIKVFDKITFGTGKYILTVGLLTSAFTALAVAMTVKTVKGVFAFMGQLSGAIGVMGKAVAWTNKMIVSLNQYGLKNSILNSALTTEMRQWWKLLTVRTGYAVAQVKSLALTLKEIVLEKLKNTALLKSLIAMKSMIVATAKSIAETFKDIIAKQLDTITTNKNTLAKKLQEFQEKKNLVTAKALIVQIYKTIVATVKATAVIMWKMIPALAKATWHIAKLGFTLAFSFVKILVLAIPKLILFAGTIISSIIPALISATVAVWGFTAALLANPITWIVLAVAAGIAVIAGTVYLIVKYWDKITAAFRYCLSMVSKFFNWMKKSESTTAKILKYLTMAIAPITQFYFYWDKIYSGIDKATKKMMEFVTWLKNGESTAAKTAKWLVRLTTPFGALTEDWGSGERKTLSNSSAGLVATSFPATAYASPSQINNQRNSSYVDQRNITINTNASSAPALYSYLRRTNDMMASGIGMAGAF